ncbi:hypothetical protein CW304_03590 [Bacillus sp. UFRGS-B20]|nr:hypothetical protein CW304_03590 [Bacillus sp. UFRGS-B20]
MESNPSRWAFLTTCPGTHLKLTTRIPIYDIRRHNQILPCNHHSGAGHYIPFLLIIPKNESYGMLNKRA